MTPIRRNQFNVSGFAAWLAANGAEVSAPTNPYELIRYRAFWQGSTKAVVHVVYTKDSGLLTYTGGSKEHYVVYQMGGDLHTNTAPKVKTKKKKTRPTSYIKNHIRGKLTERDGDDCWYCGTALGDDRTLEHLLPQSKGGSDVPENLVLAHRACNQEAADMSIAAKVELRAQMRLAKQEPTPCS